MALETIKTIENLDGTQRVSFQKNTDTGMIRYDVDRFFESAPEDEGIEIGWLNESISGLYANLTDAEKDAIITIGWLNHDLCANSR